MSDTTTENTSANHDNGTLSINRVSQFNNPTYSDCQIVFKKSGEVLHVHKMILCPHSDYFKEKFELESKIEIDEDENNEYLVGIMLESLYENRLDVEDNEVPLLYLAEKYKLTECVKTLTTYICDLSTKSLYDYTKYLDLNLDRLPRMKQMLQRSVKLNKFLQDPDSYTNLDVIKMNKFLSIAVDQTNGMQGFIALTHWVDHDKEKRVAHMLQLSTTIQEASKQESCLESERSSKKRKRLIDDDTEDEDESDISDDDDEKSSISSDSD